jgi:hypothetical protein
VVDRNADPWSRRYTRNEEAKRQLLIDLKLAVGESAMAEFRHPRNLNLNARIISELKFVAMADCRQCRKPKF